MKNLKIKEIIEKTNGKLICGNENEYCENYSKDTRTIKKGDCYIGIKGENFDGNLFWKDALKKGAKTVIVQNVEFSKKDKEMWKNKNIIIVDDTIKALYNIARAKRELYDIPVIGITGSVGKTSTKDIVANVVSQKYKTLKTEGNHNNNIGLPFTILGLKDEEAMVLEMGMNQFGEISLLTSIAKPDICIITNIGTSHIGNLGSRENILKAKLEILEGSQKKVVVINNDNDLLHKWYLKNKDNYNIRTYGIREKSMLNAKNVELNEQSSTFLCNFSGKDEKVKINVGGEHFVLNALCAITVGKILNIDPKKIINGIESFKLTKNRMEIYYLKDNIKIINDAYNASLESMKASLKVLAEYKENRKIAVLGDMFELGKYSKKIHEKVGEEVAKNKIDILIASGENSKYIVEGAKKGLDVNNIYYVKDNEMIKNVLKTIVKPNDVILFKASNKMKFYKLAEEIADKGIE